MEQILRVLALPRRHCLRVVVQGPHKPVWFGFGSASRLTRFILHAIRRAGLTLAITWPLRPGKSDISILAAAQVNGNVGMPLEKRSKGSHHEVLSVTLRIDQYTHRNLLNIGPSTLLAYPAYQGFHLPCWPTPKRSLEILNQDQSSSIL
jgi:hypothetical protein